MLADYANDLSLTFQNNNNNNDVFFSFQRPIMSFIFTPLLVPGWNLEFFSWSERFIPQRLLGVSDNPTFHISRRNKETKS